MITLNEFISLNLNEGLIDILTGKLSLEKFLSTIDKSLNDGIKIKHKGLDDKDIIDSTPIRVRFIFKDGILTKDGIVSYEQYAKSIHKVYNEETKQWEIPENPDEETRKKIAESIKLYKEDFSKIQKSKWPSIDVKDAQEDERINGGVIVSINYYNEDGNWNIYEYIDGFYPQKHEELVNSINKGHISKDVITSLYYKIFCAVCRPDDQYAPKNESEFKKYVDPQIVSKIKSLVPKETVEKMENKWKETK